MKKFLPLLFICLSIQGLSFAQCNLTLVAIGHNGYGGGANGAVTTSVSNGIFPYTYLWSQGGTTEAITGLGAGVYSVTVTDANGCMAIDTVTVESVGGLIGLNQDFSLSVYPNPSSSQWTLRSDAHFTPQRVQVLSAEGRLLMSIPMEAEQLAFLDAQSWSNGTYWIRFMASKGSVCLPIMKL